MMARAVILMNVSYFVDLLAQTRTEFHIRRHVHSFMASSYRCVTTRRVFLPWPRPLWHVYRPGFETCVSGFESWWGECGTLDKNGCWM